MWLLVSFNPNLLIQNPFIQPAFLSGGIVAASGDLGVLVLSLNITEG